VQEKDEAQYVERLQRALKEHGLYYSYSADITTRSAGVPVFPSSQVLVCSYGVLLWRLANDDFSFSWYNHWQALLCRSAARPALTNEIC